MCRYVHFSVNEFKVLDMGQQNHKKILDIQFIYQQGKKWYFDAFQRAFRE